MQQDYIRDDVQREAWDEEYRRRHGVSAPVSQQANSSSMSFRLTVRDGYGERTFDWLNGTSDQFVRTFGYDGGQKLIAQFEKPIQLQLLTNPEYRQALPYMQQAAIASGYPQGLADMEASTIPVPFVEAARSHPPAPAIAQSKSAVLQKLQSEWARAIKDPIFQAIGVSLVMVLLANPSPSFIPVRHILESQAWTKWVVTITDPINLARHGYNWWSWKRQSQLQEQKTKGAK